MGALEYTLERELAAAVTLARDPRCAAAVDTLNLRIDAAPWGIGFVEFSGDIYQPNQVGDAAMIVAAEAGGELVDLVACRLKDRAMATRIGIAIALGEDAIEVARVTGQRLLLHHDALAWMHGGFSGAVIIDWRAARSTLAGVADVACASKALARRLHRAVRMPVQLPAISYARAA